MVKQPAVSATAPGVRPVPLRVTSAARREAIAGYLFILPWIIGFLVLQLGPVIASAVLSFTSWRGFGTIRWRGIDNYVELLTTDPLFRTSLQVTLVYTVITVPLLITLALSVAFLLNSPRLRGVSVYRLIFYLPSVVAGVASALTWQWMFDTTYGAINGVLSLVGIPSVPWLTDPTWALWTFIIVAQYGIGGNMIIFLAGLKGVPESLYEAAVIDGASGWQRFWKVTIPMLTPTIFFTLVMTTIGSFQVFTTAYVITSGGPLNATLFYVLLLYQRAFTDAQMGMASAMAWILFLVIMLLTLLQFLLARRWVYYEYEAGR